jgi:hypothetical protein
MNLRHDMMINDLMVKIAITLEKRISKKDIVIKCFNEISGLEISALSADQQSGINKKILAINGILKQYPIKTYDDYSLISDYHLNKLLKNIKQICLIFCD